MKNEIQENAWKFLLYLCAILLSLILLLTSVWVYPSRSKEKITQTPKDKMFVHEENIYKVNFPINVNKASAEELELVPGIGPKMAEDIVLYIKAKGPLKSLDRLMNIPGIKEEKIAAYKEYLICE